MNQTIRQRKEISYVTNAQTIHESVRRNLRAVRKLDKPFIVPPPTLWERFVSWILGVRP